MSQCVKVFHSAIIYAVSIHVYCADMSSRWQL